MMPGTGCAEGTLRKNFEILKLGNFEIVLMLMYSPVSKIKITEKEVNAATRDNFPISLPIAIGSTFPNLLIPLFTIIYL